MKRIISLVLAAVLCLTGCAAGQTAYTQKAVLADMIVKPVPRDKGGAENPAGEKTETSHINYDVADDLSNIINAERLNYLPDDFWDLIRENQFAVYGSGGSEFFEVYEFNRYTQMPNFVTVDSMMHTYHLYFSYLLRKTEKEYLVPALLELSKELSEISCSQAEILSGSEWEEAALVNEAFFAVGAKLLDPGFELPPETAALAQEELDLIDKAEDIFVSPLLGEFEDYTQYVPRGYYEGDEELERYFRAMMWFGRRNFPQKDELTDRCALLMTLALEQGPAELWEDIYGISSFFAGKSDDNGYPEYLPVIQKAYRGIPETEDLIGSEAAFSRYHRMTEELPAPAINSIPMEDDEGKTDKAEENRGFRLMGQRFSLDAAIFGQLCYSKVEENSAGEKRLLPTGLDIPAAFGSDEALDIIRGQGDADYPNYEDQMEYVRGLISRAPEETWNASLYAQWLYTLLPVLAEKGETYPAFMRNSAWTRKSLEGFMGSLTELKHDTVLYSKQFMAEMGGGDMEKVDDRGYVEPEPEVFGRLAELTGRTLDGLSKAGMIGDTETESLERLEALADALKTIAEKELRGELPTDEEFELILTFGGQLEHFWEDAVRDQAQESYLDSRMFPAAVIVDTATDPNGRVLEFGTGIPSTVYVVVPVDGILRIASGSVYTYYEFEQPIDERLTDSKWRRMLGVEVTPGQDYPDMFAERQDVPQPEWTTGYRAYYPW